MPEPLEIQMLPNAARAVATCCGGCIFLPLPVTGHGVSVVLLHAVMSIAVTGHSQSWLL